HTVPYRSARLDNSRVVGKPEVIVNFCAGREPGNFMDGAAVDGKKLLIEHGPAAPLPARCTTSGGAAKMHSRHTMKRLKSSRDRMRLTGGRGFRGLREPPTRSRGRWRRWH